MTIHTQLPIYKVAYDLLDAISDLTAQFPRMRGMAATRPLTKTYRNPS